jgi:hypothetical protein
MKHFLDTEFLEGPQTLTRWGHKTEFAIIILGLISTLIGTALAFTVSNPALPLFFILLGILPTSLFKQKTAPTIDLISIGIVSELGQTFYAISKEFNVAEAWYRYDLVKEEVGGDVKNQFPEGRTKKVYWIRENVLKPIWRQMLLWHYIDTLNIEEKEVRVYERAIAAGEYDFLFKKRLFKRLLNIYGKKNETIAQDICKFIDQRFVDSNDESKGFIYPGDGNYIKPYKVATTDIQFYAYYADYDWVAFCWLFGKMMDLPKGFPMYCRDLKQIFDDKQKGEDELNDAALSVRGSIKEYSGYPKQQNEHHALADAEWNLRLYQFLKSL